MRRVEVNFMWRNILTVIEKDCGFFPDAGSRVECPRNINRLKKHDLWKDDDL